MTGLCQGFRSHLPVIFPTFLHSHTGTEESTQKSEQYGTTTKQKKFLNKENTMIFTTPISLSSSATEFIVNFPERRRHVAI